MQVEFTGRQITITKKIRSQADNGLERIERILGRTANVHIILTAEKNRQIVELTATTRQCNIVAKCEATTVLSALQGALEKAEKQALRHKERIRAKKRLPKEEKEVVELPVHRTHRGAKAENSARTNGNGKAAKPSIPVVVHSFPSRREVHEPHVVRTLDSVALRPMTLEEAVKEAAFRDRDVFLFRNHEGTLLVLHRKRDGKMELIEAPI
jgi:putative sigma-54 modulation protein